MRLSLKDKLNSFKNTRYYDCLSMFWGSFLYMYFYVTDVCLNSSIGYCCVFSLIIPGASSVLNDRMSSSKPKLSIQVLNRHLKTLLLITLFCVISGTYGGLGSAIALRTTMGILACPCVSRMFAIPYVQNVLDDDGNALDDKLNTDVKPMLDQLVWAATAVSNHRKCAELPVSSFFGS